MDNLQFTDEEVKDQLEALGYFNVSKERILQFKKDLHRLIESDQSSESQSWTMESSATDLDNSSFYQSHRNKQKSNAGPTTSSYQPHIKPKVNPMQKMKITEYPSSPFSNQDHNKSSNYDSSFSTVPDHSFTQSEDTIDTSSLKAALKGRGYVTEKIESDSESTVTDGLTSETSSVAGERKVLQKRKVARKQKDGTSRVYDESLVQDDHLGVYRCHDLSYDDSDPRLLRATTPTDLPARPHTARPMGKRMDSNTYSQLPSFIRPDVYPRNRTVKKEDPVEKFGHYQRAWANAKIPCEGNHKALRWQIKAQMLYKEEPAPKPQRVYVPNTYVVPTSKKRSALRWEVRHALARGIQPETGPFELY